MGVIYDDGSFVLTRGSVCDSQLVNAVEFKAGAVRCWSPLSSRGNDVVIIMPHCVTQYMVWSFPETSFTEL